MSKSQAVHTCVSGDRKVAFLITPALSNGHESEFDPEASDLFVVLNGRAGVTTFLDKSDQPRKYDPITDSSERRVAGSAHLVLACFNQSTPGNLRVACGFLQVALETAQRVGARRMTILLDRAQFSGKLDALVSTINCRVAAFFGSLKEEPAIAEIEFLSTIQDVDTIKAGFKAENPLCATCFRAAPDAFEKKS